MDTAKDNIGPVLVCAADVEPAKPVTRLHRRTREVQLLDEREQGMKRTRWHGYRVDLDRIPDAAALLGWIEHLCEKVWVKPQHIHELIQHVERENGVKVNRTA